jgi:hypothetical protein
VKLTASTTEGPWRLGSSIGVTWVDDSDPIWLPRDQLIEDGNANLVETLDANLLRLPEP